MVIPETKHEELMDLRSKLFKALIQHVQTSPAGERNLSLTQMAAKTGGTKSSMKSALESLQRSGLIAIGKGRITLNKTSVK